MGNRTFVDCSSDGLEAGLAGELGATKWYFTRLLSRAHRLAADGGPYTRAEFERVLDASNLKSTVKKTLLATAEQADQWGRTSVERRAIAERCAINVKTVSEHWKKASDAGFIVGKRRFNSSKIQQLKLPDARLPRDLPSCRVLLAHQWSEAEVDWWNHLDPSRVTLLPWTDGACPF